MKIRSIVVAGAALAFAPFAMAQDSAVQAGADCASLQAQYDQIKTQATAESVSAAEQAYQEGQRLCAEGKSDEGAAKLQEALTQLQGGAATEAPQSEPVEPTSPDQPTS